MTKNKKRSECPISCSLDLWGDKWSLLIIRDLMFDRQCTYGDFLKSEEKISTNILASRLKTLEQNMVIEKLEHPASKSKVLYQLTISGIELLPIIVEINLWGKKYSDNLPEKTKVVLKEIQKDKEGFINKTIKELKNSRII